MSKHWMPCLCALAAVVSGLLAGCGDDNDTVSTETAARYCDLSTQLEQVAASTGAASAPGVFDGSADAIKALMAQVGPALSDLKASAPDKIRGDVETTIDALDKASAGDLADVRSDKFATASRNVTVFRSEACPDTGGSSGDG